MDNRKYLNVIKNENDYILEGVFTTLDETYDIDCFYNSIEKYIEKIKNQKCYGQFGYPNSNIFSINSKNISHYIQNIWIDRNNKIINGTLILLDTFYGKEIKYLIDDGLKPYVMFRGRGVSNKSYAINSIK